MLKSFLHFYLDAAEAVFSVTAPISKVLIKVGKVPLTMQLKLSVPPEKYEEMKQFFFHQMDLGIEDRLSMWKMLFDKLHDVTDEESFQPIKDWFDAYVAQHHALHNTLMQGALDIMLQPAPKQTPSQNNIALN